MGAELDDIEASFEFFDNWEDKYRFIIDLGKALPDLPEDDRKDESLVRGCQSQVWLLARYDADADRLHLTVDSDALIVRGLIAIVLAALNDKSPRDILAYDIEQLFTHLDLFSHLSVTRGNGLRAMVGKIRATAEAHAASPP